MTDGMLIAGLAVLGAAAIVLAVTLEGKAGAEEPEEQAESLHLPEPPPTPPVIDARGRWHDPHTHRFIRKPSPPPES